MATPYEQPIKIWEAVANKKGSSNNIDAKSFTFRELATATTQFQARVFDRRGMVRTGFQRKAGEDRTGKKKVRNIDYLLTKKFV